MSQRQGKKGTQDKKSAGWTKWWCRAGRGNWETENAESESCCTTQTLASHGVFLTLKGRSYFLLKRRLSKVSLPLTVSLFGAMTRPKHRDAYITEPWQLHTYTNMQTHRVLAPRLLLPGLGPVIFLIAEEQWEGSQSNRPSDSYCLLPNNIAGSRTGRTNLSMSPQKSPAGKKNHI